MPKVKSNGKTHWYPFDKAQKYWDDLKTGKESKGSKSTPKGKKLTQRQKAYRSGYVAAMSENHVHYNLKKYGKPYNPNKFTPREKDAVKKLKTDIPVTDEFGDPPY